MIARDTYPFRNSRPFICTLCPGSHALVSRPHYAMYVDGTDCLGSSRILESSRRVVSSAPPSPQWVSLKRQAQIAQTLAPDPACELTAFVRSVHLSDDVIVCAISKVLRSVAVSTVQYIARPERAVSRREEDVMHRHIRSCTASLNFWPICDLGFARQRSVRDMGGRRL